MSIHEAVPGTGADGAPSIASSKCLVAPADMQALISQSCSASAMRGGRVKVAWPWLADVRGAWSVAAMEGRWELEVAAWMTLGSVSGGFRPFGGVFRLSPGSAVAAGVEGRVAGLRAGVCRHWGLKIRYPVRLRAAGPVTSQNTMDHWSSHESKLLQPLLCPWLDSAQRTDSGSRSQPDTWLGRAAEHGGGFQEEWREEGSANHARSWRLHTSLPCPVSLGVAPTGGQLLLFAGLYALHAWLFCRPPTSASSTSHLIPT